MTGDLSAKRAARPRLLVLASTYPRWKGDPEPGFVHELAKRLVSEFDVCVLGPHAPGGALHECLDGVEVVRYRYAPERLELLVNDGGIVTNLRRSRWMYLLVPGFVLGQAWAVWRLLRGSKVPAVAHAHWLIPQGLVLAALRAFGVRVPPFIVTSHGADLFALRGRVLGVLKRIVLRSAATATVVSEGMRTEIERLGIDATSVRVLSMGVDLRDRFSPCAATERTTNQLLFVGRLVEKKGLRHLLDAMPLILASRPDVRLVVAGFGPEEVSLRAQAERLGLTDSLSFVGAVSQEQLPALYRRAAVLVAPFVEASSGDQEGLGLVLVEALGCGCPVLVGDVAAVRDLPVDRVNVRNADALAVAVLEKLQALQVSLDFAEQARRWCLDRYDWDVVAGRYARLLIDANSSR